MLRLFFPFHFQLFNFLPLCFPCQIGCQRCPEPGGWVSEVKGRIYHNRTSCRKGQWAMQPPGLGRSLMTHLTVRVWSFWGGRTDLVKSISSKKGVAFSYHSFLGDFQRIASLISYLVMESCVLLFSSVFLYFTPTAFSNTYRQCKTPYSEEYTVD